MTTMIPLTGKRGQDKFALIDMDDLAKVWGYRWYLNDTGYAVNKSYGQTVRMHRLINETPDGLVTDHINRDTLDNRRKNLRSATHASNMRNTRSRENAKGYWFHKQVGYWEVQVDRRHYGLYETEAEAAQAARRIYNGELVPPHYVRKFRSDIHTHCVHGHCYGETGYYVFSGKVRCKVCAREQLNRSVRKRKQKLMEGGNNAVQ